MASGQYRDEARFFKKFGQRVKALRSQKGITQEEMAELGFSTRFYQRIEAGKPIHLRTALRLADAFGIDLKTLFNTI